MAEPFRDGNLWVHDYGIAYPEKMMQVDVELQAFRKRVSPEDGGLGRFGHFRNSAMLLYPKRVWHEWTDMRIRGLCENDFVGWAGCASCVAGNTRIYDPLTGENPTIESLYRNRIRPTVLTLSGPIKASIPFIKGKEDLYRVRLEDGSEFRATASHQVLTAEGEYCHVSDLRPWQSLLSLSVSPKKTSSACDPSVHVEDDPNSQKTAASSSENYSMGFHHDDGQLHLEEGNDLSTSPLSSDVQERIQHDFCEDGSLKQYKHIPLSRCVSRLSMTGNDPRHSLPCIHEPHRFDQGNPGHDGCSFLSDEQFHSEIPRTCQVSEPVPGSFHRQNSGEVSDSIHPVFCATYSNRVTQVRVVSICNTGPEIFYDLCVPVEHHYFAEGAIHHNSGKTDDAAFYAIVWWLSDPQNSTVVLTSTTKGMIRKRAWPIITRLYYALEDFPGVLIDSMTILKARDDTGQKFEKSAIFAKSVKEGNASAAAADIQGMHNKRMLLIIDEATDTPQAIFDVIPNLMASCEEFQCLVIGNPTSYFDQHGVFCEPKEGWGAIDIDDEEWETTMKMNGKPGLCQRFDALKSPNWTAGTNVVPFLVRVERIQGAIDSIGEHDPKFWKYYRGFWAPDGVINTVFSESMVLKHEGRGKLVFHSWSRVIAGLDPAFGGDRCVLKFARIGDLPDRRIAVQLTDTVLIKLDARSKEPVNYQIARRVKEECESRKCDPSDFGLDATASGGGLADIISQTWSLQIRRVEFGGNPSDTPLSNFDRRPASEICDRKVTELWFRCREMLQAGQLKGLDVDTIREFCARQYQDVKRKTTLEKKEEMKERTHKSPDLADAVAVLVEVARQLGAVPGGPGKTDSNKTWEIFSRNANAVYANVDYTEPELIET